MADGCQTNDVKRNLASKRHSCLHGARILDNDATVSGSESDETKYLNFCQATTMLNEPSCVKLIVVHVSHGVELGLNY